MRRDAVTDAAAKTLQSCLCAGIKGAAPRSGRKFEGYHVWKEDKVV